LDWVLPFYYGHIRGSLGDSVADRYRGWLFLVFGSFLYGIIVAEQEATRFLSIRPNQLWIVVVPFLVILLLGFQQLGKRFRNFVLGPGFPANEVLTRAALNAIRAIFVITIAGAYLVNVSDLSVWDLTVIGPLMP